MSKTTARICSNGSRRGRTPVGSIESGLEQVRTYSTGSTESISEQVQSTRVEKAGEDPVSGKMRHCPRPATQDSLVEFREAFRITLVAVGFPDHPAMVVDR